MTAPIGRRPYGPDDSDTAPVEEAHTRAASDARRGVFARITEVTFTPEDRPLWHRAIKVEWRGGEDHCVKQGSQVWNESEGVWEYEPQPSSREDEFIARTRYPFDQARDLAVRLLSEQINAQGKSDV